MAELTPLDEKIGEVLGLAQAAQDATAKVLKLVDDEEAKQVLERMQSEATETRQRVESALDEFEGKKTAIKEKARETKGEAEEMMRTYLSGEDTDGLDGFEFLVMAEAGELGHWEIVREMNERVGDATIRDLTEFAIPVQERHFEDARACSLKLAREEVAA
jgi:flagellar motor switch protein FliG